MKLNTFENSGNISEIEISYKSKRRLSSLTKIENSEDIYNILKSVWSDKIEFVEEFVVIPLNRANKVLGWVKVSQGCVAGTVADPKLIFQIALNTNASSIILAHNHPSGNLRPSEADLAMTKKIKAGGALLDIAVLDHLIISSEGYHSMADNCQIQ